MHLVLQSRLEIILLVIKKIDFQSVKTRIFYWLIFVLTSITNWQMIKCSILASSEIFSTSVRLSVMIIWLLICSLISRKTPLYNLPNSLQTRQNNLSFLAQTSVNLVSWKQLNPLSWQDISCIFSSTTPLCNGSSEILI